MRDRTQSGRSAPQRKPKASVSCVRSQKSSAFFQSSSLNFEIPVRSGDEKRSAARTARTSAGTLVLNRLRNRILKQIGGVVDRRPKMLCRRTVRSRGKGPEFQCSDDSTDCMIPRETQWLFL